MKLKKYITLAIVILSSFGIITCKAQTDKEKVHETMQNVLAAINQNNYLKVIDYLGADREREDTFRIKTGVGRVYYLLTKYHHNKYDSLQFFSDYKLDILARIKFSIPLFKGFDTLTGVKSATLNLYFGPPEIIPFNKLSGFELEEEVDVEYRGKLLDEGKLLDGEGVLNTLKNKK